MSLLVIILVLVYCDRLIDIIVIFSLIIIFVCLVRGWNIQDFFNHFIEMFNPFIKWLESNNINFKN